MEGKAISHADLRDAELWLATERGSEPTTRSDGSVQNGGNRNEAVRADGPGRTAGTAIETDSEQAQITLARMQAFGPGRPTPRDAVFRRLLAVADVCAAAGGLVAAALISKQRLVPASIATLPLIVLIIKLSGRYDHDEVVLRKSTLDEAPALTALAAAYALAWSVVTISFNIHSSRGAVIVLWGTTAAFLIALRAAARALAQRWAPPERILIIGGAPTRTGIAARLAASSDAQLEIVGYLPIEGEEYGEAGPADPRMENLSTADLGAVVEKLDVHRVILILSGTDTDKILEAVVSANTLGVKVSMVPRIFEVVGSSVEFDEIGGVTVLGVRRPGLSRSSTVLKRGMDIAGSAVGLIGLVPFGLMVALAIKLDSPGPVFFLQPRIGRNGRMFQMIKFRSMVDEAEAQRDELETLNESDGIFKMSRDPRITRVGRWLRRSSLDELPQLINVLRGEMSLVGPRPLVPAEDRRVEGRHRSRLQLSPGMTGPWQVLGPDRPPLSEMVKLDYLYGANWSLWSDVKCLLRTIVHVANRRGV